MRTPKTRGRRSGDAPVVVTVLSAPGRLRIPGDAEPLPVTLDVSAGVVSLETNGSDLGSWPIADVEIARIDDTDFSFAAEGDRLVFTPDDPEAFAASSIVGRTTSEKPKKRRRKEREEETFSDERREPTPEPEPRPEPRPTRRSTRKAVVDAPVPGAAAPEATVPTRPLEVPEVATDVEGEAKSSAWLRTIDAARRNGMFGLDRLPVDERQRGEDHQHTYEHGAAANSGPARYICTICGKVRLSR